MVIDSFQSPLTDRFLEDLQPYLYKQPNPDSKEVMFWCPFCHDRERHTHAHMYIERDTGYWHCFSCERGGKHLGRLLRAYGIEVSYLDGIMSMLSLSDHRDVEIYNIQDTDAVRDQLDKFQTSAYKIPPSAEAYRYLSSRGLSEEEIDTSWRCWDAVPGYAFWFCTDQSDQIIFYSGRTYYSWKEPRYYHLNATVPLVSINAYKSIVSPDFYSGRELIFLVEGIFDAFGAPGRAIPLFGKRLSGNVSPQLIKLLKRENLAVVCALDREEVEANLALAKDLHSKYIQEIYVFNMHPHKDFGERKYHQLSITGIHDRLYRYIGYNDDMTKAFLRGHI